jgi:DNA polymerase sigma
MMDLEEEQHLKCARMIRIVHNFYVEYIFYFLGIQPHFNAYFHDRSLTLAQMLTDFFEFYAFDFDYNRDAACVFSGDIQPKRFLTKNGAISARNVSYSLDITNPLEHELNVTANVQDFAVRKFRLSCDEALKKLYGFVIIASHFFEN